MFTAVMQLGQRSLSHSFEKDQNVSGVGRDLIFLKSSSNTHPRCRADDGQVPSDKRRASEGMLMAGPLDSS